MKSMVAGEKIVKVLPSSSDDILHFHMQSIELSGKEWNYYGMAKEKV